MSTCLFTGVKIAKNNETNKKTDCYLLDKELIFNNHWGYTIMNE